MEELLRIALEQLERVKRGEMPTKQGKELIGMINKLEFLISMTGLAK